tara:strand:- start:1267 stop:1728 length:462 start_codon:yes stop_codon:yes gene_type:complete
MNFCIFLFTFCEAFYYKNFYTKKSINYISPTFNYDLKTAIYTKNYDNDYFEEVYDDLEEYYERLDKYYSNIMKKIDDKDTEKTVEKTDNEYKVNEKDISKQNLENMYMRDEITLIEYKYLKESHELESHELKEKKKPFPKFGKINVTQYRLPF